MQKITTLLHETDLISKRKWIENTKQFQPEPETLKKIMKFASTYRVTQINDNQFIEFFIN